MGVDTELYLNSRWELNDIKKVVERITGEKVEVTSNHKTSIGFYWFGLPKMGRQINVFTNSKIPTGSVTHLSMHADEQSHNLFKAIAEVFGGIYMDNDYDCKCQLIEGNISDGDALAYFIKYAIVDDGIDPDDIDGFIKSMHNWHQRIEPRKEPIALQRIVSHID